MCDLFTQCYTMLAYTLTERVQIAFIVLCEMQELVIWIWQATFIYRSHLSESAAVSQ